MSAQVYGDVTNGSWKLWSLGDVCDVIAGQSPDSSAYNDKGEGVPFYQGKKDFTDRYLAAPVTWTKSITKIAEPGDILMSVRAPVGPVNETREKICIGRGLAAIRAGNEINRGYLWYVLLWLQPEIVGSAGAVFPSINKKSIEGLKIPLPPLDEQKRIVSILDQAFAALDRARENAEANLADSENLYVTQRENLLSCTKQDWSRMTVGDLCKRFEYGTSKKSLPDGKIPVLRMGNLQDGQLDWNDLVYTNDEDDIQKLKLRNGDVLFNRTNSAEHVGKTGIFRGERGAIFAGYLIRLHLNEELVNSEFINIYLNSERAREYGKTVMGKSVNQANISASKLKTYPITVPSLTEQEEIVACLNSIKNAARQLTRCYEEKLLDISDLRQSLLQKAFSGQLT